MNKSLGREITKDDLGKYGTLRNGDRCIILGFNPFAHRNSFQYVIGASQHGAEISWTRYGEFDQTIPGSVRDIVSIDETPEGGQ